MTQRVLHPLGHLRHQLGDVHAGHVGLDGAERPAGGGAGLRVPGLELARPAGEPQQDDALLLLLQLAGQGRAARARRARSCRRTRRPRRPRPPRKRAAVDGVVGRAAEGACEAWHAPCSGHAAADSQRGERASCSVVEPELRRWSPAPTAPAGTPRPGRSVRFATYAASAFVSSVGRRRGRSTVFTSSSTASFGSFIAFTRPSSVPLPSVRNSFMHAVAVAEQQRLADADLEVVASAARSAPANPRADVLQLLDPLLELVRLAVRRTSPGRSSAIFSEVASCIGVSGLQPGDGEQRRGRRRLAVVLAAARVGLAQHDAADQPPQVVARARPCRGPARRAVPGGSAGSRECIWSSGFTSP